MKEEIPALTFLQIEDNVRFYVGKYNRIKKCLNYEKIIIFRKLQELIWRKEFETKNNGKIYFLNPTVSKMNWRNINLKDYYTVEEKKR